jgi:hypothetical protein
MAIWNTAVTVVGLVEADTRDEAIARLEGKLRAAGFDPYEDSNYPSAFESEDLPEEILEQIRRES